MKHLKYILMILLCLGMAGSEAWAQSGTKKKKNKKGDKQATEQPRMNALYAEIYGNAVTQKILGNFEDALDLFSSCIREDKSIAAAYYEIGDIYYRQAQYSLVIEYATTACELDPSDKWNFVLLGSAYIELGKYKEAEEPYKALVEKFPNEVDYALDLADLYIAQKKFKDAIAVYNGIEAREGVLADISLQKKKVYQAMGKTQEAMEEIKKLISFFPGEPEYYGLLAEAYLSLNKTSDAMLAYEKVLEIDPKNPVIHFALASYYQETGNFAKAYEFLKSGFLNPDADVDDKVKILLSYYELSSGSSRRKEESDTLLDIMTFTHPAEAKTWSIRGDFYLLDKNYADARICFKKVVALESGKYVVWEQLLKLDLEQREFADLLTHATQAAELFPAQPAVYFYKGRAQLEEEKYAEALENLIAAKDLIYDNSPLAIQIKINLAHAYRLNSEAAKGIELLEKLKTLFPENAEISGGYALMLIEMGENLDKAAEMIRTAMRVSPANAEYLGINAWLLYKKGDFATALTEIEKAYTAGGNKNYQILEWYGDILNQNGNSVKALEKWTEAQGMRAFPSARLNDKISRASAAE